VHIVHSCAYRCPRLCWPREWRYGVAIGIVGERPEFGTTAFTVTADDRLASSSQDLLIRGAGEPPTRSSEVLRPDARGVPELRPCVNCDDHPPLGFTCETRGSRGSLGLRPNRRSWMHLLELSGSLGRVGI